MGALCQVLTTVTITEDPDRIHDLNRSRSNRAARALGLMSSGLMSPGLMSSGLMSPGLMSSGLMSPGLMSPGLMSIVRRGMTQREVSRLERPPCRSENGGPSGKRAINRSRYPLAVNILRVAWKFKS
jgi:hypothetical protein